MKRIKKGTRSKLELYLLEAFFSVYFFIGFNTFIWLRDFSWAYNSVLIAAIKKKKKR